MRRVLVVAVVALVAPTAALAKPSPGSVTVQRYMAQIEPKIRTYRLVAERADALFSVEPVGDVVPSVEGFRTLAADLEALAQRWGRLVVPRGLSSRHRGMRRVFLLESRAFAVWAEAWSLRGPTAITAADAQLHGLFETAAYLQRRWATALRGALLRAQLAVPTWLDGMASVPLP